MPHREFEAAHRNDDDPITFSVDGEKFTCVPVLSWTALAGLVKTASEKDPAGMALQIGPFFDSVLVDEDVERFQKILGRKTNAVDIGLLTNIIQWLTEVYTGRPTSPPSDSDGGRLTDGEPSKPEPSSAVTTLTSS